MIVIIFILGAIAGSALACFNYRRNDIKSFIFGKSECESCHTKIKPLENIPIASFILLKGKCSNCNEKIDFINFLYEIITPICFILAYIKYGLSYNFIILLSQILLLLSISFTDFKMKEVYSVDLCILFGISLLNLFEGESIVSILVSCVIGGIFYIFTRFSVMGEADVILGFISGFYAKTYMDGFLIFRNSFILAAIYALILIFIYKKDRKFELAFCPFISMAIFTVIL